MRQGARANPQRGPSPADRAALLRKYRILAAWRRIKDSGEDSTRNGREQTGQKRDQVRTQDGTSETHRPPDREALRRLAQEFPGALRELDVLGLPELSRRIAYLEHPEHGRPPTDTIHDGVNERWPDFILAYHELMRAALVIKRTSAKTPRSLGADQARELLAARKTAGLPIDVSFARDVVDPPSGRLTIVVLAALARHFKVSATEISRTLFPARRAAARSQS